MPINQADARQLAQIMLKSYGEDYDLIGQILLALRTDMPTIDWMGALTDIATTYQPFLDLGLSIDWWLAEVNRRSTP